MYGEFGRVPLSIIRKERILKYWFEVLSNQNSLVYRMYKMEMDRLDTTSDSINNRNTCASWVAAIKDLLYNLGFAYIWNSQSVTNLQLRLIIERLYDQYIQNWYGSVNQSSKLVTYKTLKTQFQCEKYLSCVQNNNHRIALSRLRCSAHKLVIEEGRYRNIEKDMRLCQFCSMNILENEYHFLLVCPAYREIRKSILPNYYCRWPTATKFTQIMTDTQSGIIKRLAKFVYVAFEKRKLLLQN
ncbi:MAG: hypothetical protein KZQ70_12965 [gamma proteobacterium symbiont of Lucinoma myriamae]|nr:hypothetical protein [gamma proteobacterium symbiont of Lucinoma myriamae]